MTSAEHALLRAATQAVNVVQRDLVVHRVTAGQLLVLVVVAGNEGPSQINIADAARLDRSTVGDIVRRLQRLGRSRTDARATAVNLATRGWEVLEAMNQLVADIEEEVRKVPPVEADEFILYWKRAMKAFRRGKRHR